MDVPTMMEPRVVARDTTLISATLPIPGLGVLPVNAFAIRAREPVLVDTGVIALGDAYLEQICATLDPAELRWIWLTHTDADHTGALDRLLALAPRARVVTSFLGMGKLGLVRPLPPERVFLINPGQTLNVGDRTLVAVRPPVYDAPETTGLFDSKSRVLFSADSFGALLRAPADSARAIAPSDLREGLVAWSLVDAPWIRGLDEGALRASLATYSALSPDVLLSSHLPPAPGMLDTLAEFLLSARTATPAEPPDQAALEQMLKAS